MGILDSLRGGSQDSNNVPSGNQNDNPWMVSDKEDKTNPFIHNEKEGSVGPTRLRQEAVKPVIKPKEKEKPTKPASMFDKEQYIPTWKVRAALGVQGIYKDFKGARYSKELTELRDKYVAEGKQFVSKKDVEMLKRNLPREAMYKTGTEALAYKDLIERINKL
jgi:hypothetical protein